MKRLLLSSVAFVAAAGSSAIAADMPAYEPAPVAVPAAVNVYTWTGFYLGASAGGAWTHGDDRDLELCGGEADPFTYGNTQLPILAGDEVLVCTIEDEGTDDFVVFPEDDDGFFTDDDDDDARFLAGVHAGYNWQVGNFVVGAEGEAKFFFDDADGGEAATDFAIVLDAGVLDNNSVDGLGTVEFQGDDGIDWLGLATMRAGALLGDRNQALVYVKGGLAFSEGGDGGFEGECGPDDGAETQLANCRIEDDEDDDWNVGWAIGGGLEFKLTQNFSLGLEYLYVDVGGDNDDDATLRFDSLVDNPAVPEEVETELAGSGGGDDNLHLFNVRGTFHF